MKKELNILAISGSLRNQSSNTLLMHAMIKLAPPNLKFEVYKGLNDLPHFNPDLDVEEGPVSVQNWRAQLRHSDGVLICTPEYGNGVPGALKNALDWIVSSGEWLNKPTIAIAASPSPMGGDKAHASLLLTLNMINAQILHDASLTIPHITLKMNKQGIIIDSETQHALESSLLRLENACTNE
ncbi:MULTISPECIES: NADPH-dependent FMN reductase [unclassified Paenibacillus]|uniref:NADPH-dependent FMN reductase n=1 Tax=unclassified Paenibacillus TaxID=185978 RepID=UPI0003F8E52F|nr:MULTISPECIES: NADPH-dependent FMN reductase [unclassified Paenibacillus]KGP78588.1 flavoprotein [Paenibacillus sp. MAEPY2]KGP86555.1 flavoprotein [Paenibacillus sp. MAEPY1]